MGSLTIGFFVRNSNSNICLKNISLEFRLLFVGVRAAGFRSSRWPSSLGKYGLNIIYIHHHRHLDRDSYVYETITYEIPII